MSDTFRPRLVNGRFGDPALFVQVAYEREAVLFDLGDLSSLSGRDLLRVGTIGVSHMHIDHLIGFDALLRVNVGRDARIAVFGPDGLADRLGHKLQGYSWDLVDRYAAELVFEVSELFSPETLRRWRFRLSHGFAPEPAGEAAAPDGMLIDTTGWRISARILQHHGPCLGFAIEEPCHVNVWRNRVEEMGLEVGPWLKGLKDLVRQEREDDAPVLLPDGSTVRLASLRHLVGIKRGMKIGYVVDIADCEANRAALRDLCSNADILFIEAAFAAHDTALARERAHLTTTAAGEIARECGARRVEPFHFSPRYEGEEELRLAEVQAAFEGRRSGKELG